jgi:HSP20 family protein
MVWDDFGMWDRWFDEWDRMFPGFFRGGPQIGYKGKGSVPANREHFRPALADVYETEGSVIACFELPGAKKEDIDVSISDGMIEVKVESGFEKQHEDKDKGTRAYERRSSQFYQRVMLPDYAVADKAEANYKNGVLRIEVPKREKQHQDKKRKIQIR